MKKIAINGLGRIGKLVFQYLLESEGYGKDYEVVAINDLTNVSQLAYLLKYDTTQLSMLQKGHTIGYNEETNSLIVDGKTYPVYAQPDPKKLPWKELGIDVVCECTGRFAKLDRETGADQHLVAGAKHVMVNAPVKGTKNIVNAVNDNTLDGTEEVICGASCTTNCLAPLLKILNDVYGIDIYMMDTIHSYTADQSILDCPHKKGENSRRGRCAGQNIVPASTGAAEAVGKALPELNGKGTGMAFRVPTATGSVVSLTAVLNAKVTAEEVNKALEEKVDHKSISYTDDPVVSSDIIGIEYGSYVDRQSTATKEYGEKTLVKVVSWYDNEASYTHQYVKTLVHWLSLMK